VIELSALETTVSPSREQVLLGLLDTQEEQDRGRVQNREPDKQEIQRAIQPRDRGFRPIPAGPIQCAIGVALVAMHTQVPAALVHPGIEEALAPGVGFSAFSALNLHDSGGDRNRSVDVHLHGLGGDLLLLGVVALTLARNSFLLAAIVVDEDNRVVEDLRQRPGSPVLWAWFHSFSRATIFPRMLASLLSCPADSGLAVQTRTTHTQISLMPESASARYRAQVKAANSYPVAAVGPSSQAMKSL
jgi:hypothetical protein